MRLEDLQGRRLGRYEIIAVLGRGGMAAVYRAHDTVLRRDVALKVLYPQYVADTTLIKRFEYEAVLAAGLDHPNIVPIYDVGEADGLVYIAMKLLGGRSLADVLRTRGSLPLAEVVPIVEQIASALDYAHARGIVHRDIKAGNILLEEGGIGDWKSGDSLSNLQSPISNLRAILTDFGIAKSLGTSGLTGTGVLIGTPDYMAPEQIRSGQTVDYRADIYALGVLVFRCLTGRLPFEGGTEEVLLGHLQGSLPDPSMIEPSLPPDVDSVIRKALARRPDDRYQRAGLFAYALGAAAGLEPPTPPPARRREIEGRAVVPRAAAEGLPLRAAPNEATRRGDAAPPIRPGAKVTTHPPSIPPESGGEGRVAAPRRGAAGSIILAVALALLIGGGLLFTQTLWNRNNGSSAGSAPARTPTAPTRATPPNVAAPPTQPPAPSAAPTEPAPLGPTAAPPTAAPATPQPNPLPTGTPPPTDTPLPTSTSAPTDTPLPTPCAAQVVDEFARLLKEHADVQQRLGCPLQREADRPIAEQSFERGAMVWAKGQDESSGTIYPIFLDKSRGKTIWQSFEDTWKEGDPEDSGNDTPPFGRYEPIRGFGKLWYADREVHDTLGWATETEQAGTGAYQPFAKGSLLFSSLGLGSGPTIYVLYGDGTLEQYAARQ